MNDAHKARIPGLLKWFGSLLSIVLLVYLLSQQGWHEIITALTGISLWYFGAAVVLMLVSRFAVTFRWHMLLRATNQKVGWEQSLRLTFAGLFATNFLPTTIGGDIVRVAGAVQYGLDGTITAASVIVDRLVGMFGMLLMIPMGLSPLMDWFVNNPVGSQLQPATGVLATAVPMVGRIWQKTLGVFKKIIRALKLWIRQPSSLLASLAFTFIHMLSFFGIFALLFISLGDPMPFRLIAGLYSFVYLVTLLPVSINGYGLQELSISVIFSQVGGVSIQNSLTVALIFRTLTMLASLPGVIFVPGIIAARQENRVPQEPSES